MMIKLVGYVASIVIIAAGMFVLLTGMSYGMEFIGLSQVLKVLGMLIIAVGAIGLFATINYGKW